MPRRTEWILRLEPALEELRLLPCAAVDRATVQRLFHVSYRHAVRLLHQFGAGLAGRSLVIDRLTLIARLEALRNGEAVQFEVRRHRRVADALLALRRELAARKINVESPLQAWEYRLANLPDGLTLEKQRLQVSFASTRQLLSQLFALSQAIANDFESFQTWIESD